MELSRCSASAPLDQASQRSRKRDWTTASSSFSSSCSSSMPTTCSTASDASWDDADSGTQQQRCKLPKRCDPHCMHTAHAAAGCYATNSEPYIPSVASASWDCRQLLCLQQLVHILRLLKYCACMYSGTGFKLPALWSSPPMRICFAAAWRAKKLAAELLTTTGGAPMAVKALCVARLGFILGLKLILGVTQTQAMLTGVQASLPLPPLATAGLAHPVWYLGLNLKV